MTRPPYFQDFGILTLQILQIGSQQTPQIRIVQISTSVSLCGAVSHSYHRVYASTACLYGSIVPPPPVIENSNATTRFLPAHIATYGLKVSACHPSSDQVSSCVCHPSSGQVSSCVCCLCVVFGREEKVGGKRARTSNVKYFKPFRTDVYQRHLS